MSSAALKLTRLHHWSVFPTRQLLSSILCYRLEGLLRFMSSHELQGLSYASLCNLTLVLNSHFRDSAFSFLGASSRIHIWALYNRP
jgi:hypothetical protein